MRVLLTTKNGGKMVILATILIGLIVCLINVAIGFVEPMLDGMVDAVFRVENFAGANLQPIISSLKQVLYQVGTGLIVLKFLKKAFDIYVLWSDGDPDADPASLLINFIKAIITAIAFPYLYELFVDVAHDLLDRAFVAIDGSDGIPLSERLSQKPWESLDILTAVFSLVFFLCLFILFLQFMKRGLELAMAQVCVPLACCGLLDNDKGVFRQYVNQFVKAILTTLFQIIFCRLGVELMVNLYIDKHPLGLFWPVACLITAMGAPKVMNEFLIPTGGGGITQKIYSAGMAANMFRKAFK